MIERLISFAAPPAEGAGAPSYGAVALRGDTAWALLADPDRTRQLDEVEAARGEGTLRLQSDDAGATILGIAAHATPLGFESDGRSISAQAIGVSAELPDGTGFDGPGVSWAFEGGAEAQAIRTAWALLADGSLFLLFATREAGVAEHASESIGTARISKDGAVQGWAEPLLSTEYDAAGDHVRATLELWGEEEGALPDRGAGTRLLGGRVGSGLELAGACFEWRLAGSRGIGAYEIITA